MNTASSQKNGLQKNRLQKDRLQKNRLRKGPGRARGVGLLTAGTAAAVIAGALAAPPAQALVPDVTAVSAGCMAGDEEVSDSRVPGIGSRPPIAGSGPIADCTESGPSTLAWLADGAIRIISIVVPLDVSVQEINGAAALGPGSTATIRGRGLNLAVGGGVIGSTRGHATAYARNTFSAAVAVGAMRGDAYAESLLGLAVGVGALNTGAYGDANALPGGIALAISTDGKSSATALGGFALASNTKDPADRARCTAVYAEATNRGGNPSTCTGVLFLFERYRVGDGSLNYAIKNPLSLGFVSPVTGGVSPAIETALEGLDLGAVATLAGTRFIPVFRSDLIRLELHDDGSVRVGTDVFDWLRGLLPGGSSAPELPDVAGAVDSLTDSLGQGAAALGGYAPEPLDDDVLNAIACADAAGTADACTEGPAAAKLRFAGTQESSAIDAVEGDEQPVDSEFGAEATGFDGAGGSDSGTGDSSTGDFGTGSSGTGGSGEGGFGEVTSGGTDSGDDELVAGVATDE